MAVYNPQELLKHDVVELFHYHDVHNLVDGPAILHQPYVAGITELQSKHIGPAALTQLQGAEPLALFFWVAADPLDDGSCQVAVFQKILDWQLPLGRPAAPFSVTQWECGGQMSWQAESPGSADSGQARGPPAGLLPGPNYC